MIWHVIFHPKEKKHWWARRFSHVSLAGFSNDTWTQLDLGRQGVDVRVFFARDEVIDYLSFLTAHHVVMRFGEATPHGAAFWRPMTCVAFVKHTLGLRVRALSPDALFAILDRETNTVIINDPEGSQGNG